MRILLSAFIGSHNLGDEALASVIINKFEKESGLNLTVISIDPKKTAPLTHSKNTKIVKAGILNFFKQLNKSDILVLGGGGIIQDGSSIVNMLYYFLQVFFARKIFKKRVFLLFVGVGPIKFSLSRTMLKLMSKWVEHSLVRDTESASMLFDNKFNKESVTVTFDAVFNIINSDEPKSKSEKLSYGEYLLFCPRDWFFTRKLVPTKYALRAAKKDSNSELYIYRQSLLSLVDRLLNEEENLNIVAVPFYFTQDLDLINWIKERVDKNHSHRFIVIDKELLPDKFLKIAAKSRAILGVRLHSLILGAVLKRPLIPMVYAPKVGSLVEYLGLNSVATYLEKPDFDFVSTVTNIQKCLNSKASYTKKLTTIMQKNNDGFSKFFSILRRDNVDEKTN